jgi:hypothetical protein
MDDQLAIIELLEKYFSAVFDGDVGILNALYHPCTQLFGEVKGQPYAKTLVLYLSGVRHRECPRNSGKPFKGEVLSVILINTIGVARVRIEMFDHEYQELLSFYKLDNRWTIVHHLISSIPQ